MDGVVMVLAIIGGLFVLVKGTELIGEWMDQTLGVELKTELIEFISSIIAVIGGVTLLGIYSYGMKELLYDSSYEFSVGVFLMQIFTSLLVTAISFLFIFLGIGRSFAAIQKWIKHYKD